MTRPLHDWPTGELRNHLLDLASTIAGSTGLVDLVDRTLQVRSAQAEAGRRSREKHAAKVRVAIRRAAGLEGLPDGTWLAPLPLHWPGWPGAVAHRLALDPKRYGLEGALEGAPSDDTIRDEWELLKKAPITLP